jgi:Outer membrane protein
MKKFIILLFLIIPMGLFAQDVKLAYVNTQEIFFAMPEYSAMETQLADLNSKYENELRQMEEEYRNKYTAYIAQQDSLTDNIKMRRMQEIEDIRSRMENFVPVAQQDVQTQQSALIQPIQQKLRDAINAVGSENGYTCIIDPAAMLYMGSNVIDATPLVRAKLGLR